MDFGLREWLIIIGLLVIAGILFDGWRRMGGRSKIRFKLERNLKDQPEGGDIPDDLLGPPRVIRRDERPEPSLSDDFADFDPPGLDRGRASREPEQVGLDLGAPGIDDGLEPLGETRARPRRAVPRNERGEPRSSTAPLLSEDEDPVAGEPTYPGGEPASAPEPAARPTPIKARGLDREEPSLDEPKAAPKDQGPVQEVLVINVVARSEDGFHGSALMQNIMESGLRFGEMNIFHRHESMSGNGDVLFSMANALKPGVFDLDEMDASYVRAVSFFMGLPGPRHPKQALDLMIAAARKLAHELGGDLKDEQRSVLTAQTIEHYRQRIAEFERKHYNLRRT
ncbi:cell division protein ZipA [Pseudomonas sp.]|uniref:cell division protein ZipA n=1 Tax=Pseudomonas sp. TaxID=306 RepID=UPI002729948C|nr:cell division protein ZipA [Pseudomonas sp.]